VRSSPLWSLAQTTKLGPMPYEVHLAISLGENRSRFAPFGGPGPKGEHSDALSSRRLARKIEVSVRIKGTQRNLQTDWRRKVNSN
jgi:hypothetical protein